MREILFRGLHRRKGEKVRLDGTPVESKWVYGGYCQYNEERGIIYQTEPEIHKFPVYADSVGQYTGLTDNTGTKIFEGDIVVCYSRNFAEKCVVIFEDCEFNFVPVKWYKADRQEHGKYRTLRTFRCFDRCVIGNIHDNPEMVEGDDET